MTALVDRLEWGLVPAVPVPFRGSTMDREAQRGYARWMAGQPVAGVAVWAHTGRGPHLSAEDRKEVLEAWREAMPDRVIVAGARDAGVLVYSGTGNANGVDGDQLLLGPPFVITDDELARVVDVVSAAIESETARSG